MTVTRIEKELWKEAGADTGVMPRAMKYKGTEGRATGHRCGSGWEYIRERHKKRQGLCMFANQCEILYLPACLWTLHLLEPTHREKSADFVYQAGWRSSALCCCALVTLRACLQEPDDMIWAPLGQGSQKLTSPLMSAVKSVMWPAVLPL